MAVVCTNGDYSVKIGKYGTLYFIIITNDSIGSSFHIQTGIFLFFLATHTVIQDVAKSVYLLS